MQSFGSGLRGLSNPATEQEYRLRHSEIESPDRSSDALLARNAELVLARRSRKFTRFEGNLAGAPIPEITDRVLSATRLEGYLACPHAIFLRYLLGVEPPLEDDEDRITALDRGSLIHEILERFIAEQLPMEFGYVWTEADLARLLALTDEVCARYEGEGRTGHPLVWAAGRRELDEQMLSFFEAERDFRLSQQLRPVATELGFGQGADASDPLEIQLSDGRTVKLRGSIDRVDVAADGGLVISDYKSGQQKYFKDITPESPLGDNGRLQLPIYAFAARNAAEAGQIDGAKPSSNATAAYWFFGVDSGKRTAVELTSQTEQDARAVIENIIVLMTRGVFPQRAPELFPGGTSKCDFCAPHGRGADELTENWRRIESDPALTEFIELAGLLNAKEQAE